MSYCVNCGVELDHTSKGCPLCNTPVINPKNFNIEELFSKEVYVNKLVSDQEETPFPKEKGTVEVVKRKDLGILLSALAIATSATCGLLNLLVFSAKPWSLAIIGLCVLLWVFMIPAVIYTKQPVYVSILYDGLAVILYLYMISHMINSKEWFWGLGVPIVVLATVIIEIFAVCLRKLPRSFLTIALYFFTSIALICVGTEIIVDYYAWNAISLSWSAIVLTVCVIVDITIITLLSRKRLRNAVRRRLHF